MSNRILNVKIQYSAVFRMSKIGFLMSKFDIRPQFECRNGILNVKICIRPGFECQNGTSNVNCDIHSQLECQNRILNVEIRYSASV